MLTASKVLKIYLGRKPSPPFPRMCKELGVGKEKEKSIKELSPVRGNLKGKACASMRRAAVMLPKERVASRKNS